MATVNHKPHEVYDADFNAARAHRTATIQSMRNLKSHTPCFIALHFPGWKVWDILSLGSAFYTRDMLYDLEHFILPNLVKARNLSDALKAITVELKRKYPGVQPVVVCRMELDAVAFGASTRGTISFWERIRGKAVKAIRKREMV